MAGEPYVSYNQFTQVALCAKHKKIFLSKVFLLLRLISRFMRRNVLNYIIFYAIWFPENICIIN